jgi:glycosyltransferase involved in cell wall biosynthesis
MVIHIITRLALGGAQQIVYELAKRLKESGESVVVLTGHSMADAEDSTNNDVILDNIIKQGVATRICRYFRNSISPLNDILAIFWLVKNLKELKPTVVHIHSSKTGILGRISCKIARAERVIYHVHGWSFSSAIGIRKQFYLSLEKLFFYLTDHYIFVCKQDIDDFISFGGNKKIGDRSSVIYPGADFVEIIDNKKNQDDLRLDLGLNKDDFVVGAIARLDYQKNPLFFIRFAGIYSKINKKAKFLWIGDGVQFDIVSELIEKEGIKDKVILPGYITDVEHYFSVFDVFAITSRYEGLPLTCVKALANGVPIVGFLRNGMIDLHDMFDSFFGVPFNQMTPFIEAVERARNFMHNEKDTLQRESSLIREQFNADVMCGNIISLYNQPN